MVSLALMPTCAIQAHVQHALGSRIHFSMTSIQVGINTSMRFSSDSHVFAAIRSACGLRWNVLCESFHEQVEYLNRIYYGNDDLRSDPASIGKEIMPRVTDFPIMSKILCCSNPSFPGDAP